MRHSPSKYEDGITTRLDDAAQNNADSVAFQDAVSAPYKPSAMPVPMDPVASAVSSANLGNRFTYHPPKGDQQERYVCIRSRGLAFAELLTELTPTSPEQALAIRKIEEAVMWANAAIARNE